MSFRWMCCGLPHISPLLMDITHVMVVIRGSGRLLIIIEGWLPRAQSFFWYRFTRLGHYFNTSAFLSCVSVWQDSDWSGDVGVFNGRHCGLFGLLNGWTWGPSERGGEGKTHLTSINILPILPLIRLRCCESSKITTSTQNQLLPLPVTYRTASTRTSMERVWQSPAPKLSSPPPSSRTPRC